MSQVYGDPDVHPQPESYWGNVNPIGPRACYDEGKRVAETLAYAYNKRSGVDIRVARIFNTYGPRMHAEDGRVVSNFVIQVTINLNSQRQFFMGDIFRLWRTSRSLFTGVGSRLGHSSTCQTWCRAWSP